jgi:16S rRNA (guanine527-N7)-methyltransferase
LPRAVVDLGSGAGVPGLVLATRWETSFLLVDAHRRRAAFLTEAIRELELTGRVAVAAVRAEELGRTPAVRGTFQLATARGFGRPAVVAECAAPLLAVGGRLVVSEPPPDVTRSADRWPSPGLEKLGMAGLGMREVHHPGREYHFVIAVQELVCPPRFPRRVGIPAKRPLF